MKIKKDDAVLHAELTTSIKQEMKAEFNRMKVKLIFTIGSLITYVMAIRTLNESERQILKRMHQCDRSDRMQPVTTIDSIFLVLVAK